MIIKQVNTYDLVQYKEPSMVISFCKCNWKCCYEANIPNSVCQNSQIAKMENIETSPRELYNLYCGSPFSKCIVLSGLEPFLQFDEVYSLIDYFRSRGCDDPFVIYTGYYKDEVRNEVERLAQFPNIIIKFGRYIPGQEKHFDDVLGVELASDNQYAEKIS